MYKMQNNPKIFFQCFFFLKQKLNVINTQLHDLHIFTNNYLNFCIQHTMINYIAKFCSAIFAL